MQNVKLHLLSNFTTRLAGAGFTIFLLFLFLFISEKSLFNFVEVASSWQIWAVIFGYGTVCSFLIDSVLNAKQIHSHGLRVVFYLVAGFIFFLFLGLNAFTIIAGFVGAICAGVFYIGTIISRELKWFKITFALIVPVFFLVLIQFDFTSKKGWKEVRMEGLYQADFQHFTGKHEIPIELKEGNYISFSVKVQNANDGGHGYRFENEQGELVGMTERAEGLEVVIEEAGTYKIVITGDKLAGGITVEWTIKEEH